MAKRSTKLAKKTVSCTFCSGPIEVSTKTMSIFCPHCSKRVVCEDYVIKSYQAVRSFSTCGDVIVERKGHVVAPVRAESLVVRGLVRGDVTARARVEIASTGTIQGNVEAPALVMHDGGKLIGSCKITRNGTTHEGKPADQKSASSGSPTGVVRGKTPGGRPAPVRRTPTRVRA